MPAICPRVTGLRPRLRRLWHIAPTYAGVMAAGTGGKEPGMTPMPWPQMQSDRIVESGGRRERAGRRTAAVVGALLVAVMGFPLALLLSWVAAWNWEPWERSDADRRRLIAGAVAVVVATVGLMAIMLWRGFRNPDR